MINDRLGIFHRIQRLFNDIMQVQSGELVTISNYGEISNEQIFTFSATNSELFYNNLSEGKTGTKPAEPDN